MSHIIWTSGIRRKRLPSAYGKKRRKLRTDPCWRGTSPSSTTFGGAARIPKAA